MRLDDLAIRTQTPLDTDKILLEKFRAHERVEFDLRTNLYSFKVSHCNTSILFMILTFTIA
jgi:transcription initiation factor TFIIE subunit beta